jgi:hypothetical protein
MPRTAFKIWADAFSPDEIDDLAFLSVGLSAAELRGTTVEQKARNLQEYVRRRGPVEELALFEAIIGEREHLEADLVAAGWDPRSGGAAKPTPSSGSISKTSTTASSGQEPVTKGLVYENFDLRILTQDADGSYRIQITRNPENMEMDDVKQKFPLDNYDFTDLVDYLSGLVAQGSDARQLGQMMRDLLFPGRIGEIFFANMNNIRRQGKGLRIRLRIDPPELSKLPWEYCYGGDDFGFFALDPRTPLVRYVGRPFESPALAIPNPMKVLVAISAPSDQKALNSDEEERRIRNWLSVMGSRVQLRVIRNATPQRIQAALTDSPQIFHFIGHGEFVDGIGKLVFENDFGMSEYRDSEQLKVMLRGRDVKVVILNACKSAAGDVHAAFAGVAPALVQADIPAVIAMQFNVPDPTALGFTQDLYRYLMSGYPLDQAVTEMRAGAFNNANDKYFWGIPALYMRSSDGRLWEADADLLAKFEEVRETAVEMVNPTLPNLLQQIKDEISKTADIDDRDREYILRGLDDGLKAVNENNSRDVDYYLNRVIVDLKRSGSSTVESKIIPKVEFIIRRAKEELT